MLLCPPLQRPNLVAQEIDVPHGRPVIVVFAVRDIAPGEELTVTYTAGLTDAGGLEKYDQHHGVPLR